MVHLVKHHSSGLGIDWDKVPVLLVAAGLAVAIFVAKERIKPPESSGQLSEPKE